MTREARIFRLRLGLIVLLAFGAMTASAQTRPTRVFVHAPAPEHAALERLVAELRSEGFDAQRVAPEEPSPCAPGGPRERSNPGAQETPFAGIEIDRDASDGRLVARLCHAPALERAVVSAPSENAGRLALAAVEALHGLTASPWRATPTVREAPPARATPAAIRAPVALNANALLVLQPMGGRPFAGVSVGVEHSVQPALALALEVFLPVSASSAAGLDRELSSSAAWARLGARTHTSLPWLKLGASFHAGMSLIWATARTRDPALIGGTEFAKAALLSGGLWLESPGESLLYLRATGNASRLVPSARVEFGGGRTQDFGNLLVEIGLGVGVRWSGPDPPSPNSHVKLETLEGQ